MTKKGHKQTEEHKIKRGLYNKGSKNKDNCEYYKRISERMETNNPMFNRDSIEKRKKTIKEQGILKGENNPFYGRHHNPSSISKIKEKAKERLKDKTKHPMYGKKCPWITKRNLDYNFQKKVRESLEKRPTKPEKVMIEIIKENNIPFNYVGDGKIWFRGEKNNFNPDFLSKNPKHIIEVFGDYWHNLPNNKIRDKERLLTYSKYGYKTLVIWEHEIIKDERYGKLLSKEDIINKIKTFINN